MKIADRIPLSSPSIAVGKRSASLGLLRYRLVVQLLLDLGVQLSIASFVLCKYLHSHGSTDDDTPSTFPSANTAGCSRDALLSISVAILSARPSV